MANRDPQFDHGDDAQDRQLFSRIVNNLVRTRVIGAARGRVTPLSPAGPTVSR